MNWFIAIGEEAIDFFFPLQPLVAIQGGIYPRLSTLSLGRRKIWREKRGKKTHDHTKRQRDFSGHRWREKKTRTSFFFSFAVLVAGGVIVRGSTFFLLPLTRFVVHGGIYPGFDDLKRKKVMGQSPFSLFLSFFLGAFLMGNRF